MTKGMIFDVWREWLSTFRAMALDDKRVVNLETLEIYDDIDFESEVEEIIIEDIFDYGY